MPSHHDEYIVTVAILAHAILAHGNVVCGGIDRLRFIATIMAPKPIAISRPKNHRHRKKKASGRSGTGYAELAQRRALELANATGRADRAEQRADLAEQRADDAEQRADAAHAHLLDTQLLLVEAERRLVWTMRWPCRTCWVARLADEEVDNRAMIVEAAEDDLASSS